MLFYALAAVAVFSAISMVGLVRNVVAGAMSLLASMVSLAGIYVLLDAPFLAAAQLLVYTGSVVVLFLFIILLFDLRAEDPEATTKRSRLLRTAGSVLVLCLLPLWISFLPEALPDPAPVPERLGEATHYGSVLITQYFVPLQLIALLLLVAVVGGVILAKRRID
jgi:NADH-quinone oxidoreductase subunit J